MAGRRDVPQVPRRPSSVDPSWHEFLVDYSPEPTSQPAAEPTRVTSPLLPSGPLRPPRRHPLPADTAAAGNGVVAALAAKLPFPASRR